MRKINQYSNIERKSNVKKFHLLIYIYMYMANISSVRVTSMIIYALMNN